MVLKFYLTKMLNLKITETFSVLTVPTGPESDSKGQINGRGVDRVK